jgi:hypothetical protein
MISPSPFDALSTKSYMKSAGEVEPNIIFEGKRHMWRSRLTVDILLAEHLHYPFSCVEIVATDTRNGLEAPRMYLSAQKLYSSIDENEVQLRASEKSREISRKDKWGVMKPIYSDLVHQTRRDLAVQFILGRIQVECSVSSDKSLTIDLATLPGDMSDPLDPSKLDMLIEKPYNLTPVTTAYGQEGFR